MSKVWDYDERSMLLALRACLLVDLRTLDKKTMYYFVDFQREVSICQRELDALHCDRASMLPRVEKICQEARKYPLIFFIYNTNMVYSLTVYHMCRSKKTVIYSGNFWCGYDTLHKTGS